VVGFISDHFTPVERAPNVHWVGGCEDPEASVDGLKNLLPVLGIVSQLFGCPAYSVLTVLTGSVQGISISYGDLSIFMNVQFLVITANSIATFYLNVSFVALLWALSSFWISTLVI